MTIQLATIFLGSFILALSGALMPGPLFTVTVADSAKRGFISGPLLICGHAILELSLVIAVVLGLGPLLEIPLVTAVIALLGGSILLWMGIGMYRKAALLSLYVGNDSSGALANPVLAGILASLSNPYWIIWWATIGLGYLVAARKFGTPGIVVFFIGHILADLAWYSVISYAVSRGRKLMSDPAYRNIIRACGFILVGFGIWFLSTSAGYFISNS